MKPQPFRALTRYFSRHFSLRFMFTVPVLLQLVGAVGLVGYLSFQNGQRAVQNLAIQLRSELSARIKRELEGYFRAPHAINRLNATAMLYGDLDVVNATGENMLYQQMRIYPTIAFVYCGSARSGEFFGVLRSPDTGQLQLSIGNKSNNFLRDYYSLDVRGSRMHWLYQASRAYDSRTRPWYQAAIETERPVWTEVYLAFTTGLPNVTASLPVYDNAGRQLLGVCATDVVLPEEFRSFLANLEIGESGEAFVIDRQGNLISSSTDEPLISGQGEYVQFLKAVNSRNPLVRNTANYLLEQFGQFDRIRQPQQLEFYLENHTARGSFRDRQFLEVLPFEDGFGLDWLIVVVVPESDFMAEITANTRTTILLCLVALAIAVVSGIILTRRVTSPILHLNSAVRDIARGNWDRTVDLDREDELGELADSFNTMTTQLQASFASLERQKDSFSRFFPSEYLEFLGKADVTQVELGDHLSQEMAIMFSDIRSFTSLSEKMTPQETFNFINGYLQRVVPEIRSHNGVIIKYLGDGLMAVFPKSADDAVLAGIAQLRQLEGYNQERKSYERSPIQVGIGIHTGHMLVGIVGEQQRIEGDALSDNVNLTSRLEGLTKHYGVPLLVSGDLLTRLLDPSQFEVRFLDQAIVKGRTEPIAIYEVLDAHPDWLHTLKLQTLPAFEKGLDCYRLGHLEEARKWFFQILTHNPQDATVRLYLKRIDQLSQQGLPEHWDGIWVFTEK
jgi:class 3 adenylate cyclase/HAMP domain-containing protein